MLVDDDEDDRDLFGMALKRVGVKVNYIDLDNALKALQYLDANEQLKPDFIFLDLNW